MKKTIAKFGKKVAAFAVSVGTFALPAVVAASTLSSNINSNLAKFSSKSGLQNNAGLVDIIGAVIGTILALLGVILVILIVYAGFLWMTSQGDPGKVKKAKDMIYQAVIGLLIVFAAYAITNFVMGALVDTTQGNVYTGQ